MRTIYKYMLQITDLQQVTIPYGAKVLSVQDQDSMLCLWAEVNIQNDNTLMDVRILGTGNPIPDSSRADWVYVSTVLQSPFVWHVYVPSVYRSF